MSLRFLTKYHVISHLVLLLPRLSRHRGLQSRTVGLNNPSILKS